MAEMMICNKAKACPYKRCPGQRAHAKEKVCDSELCTATLRGEWTPDNRKCVPVAPCKPKRKPVTVWVTYYLSEALGPIADAFLSREMARRHVADLRRMWKNVRGPVKAVLP